MKRKKVKKISHYILLALLSLGLFFPIVNAQAERTIEITDLKISLANERTVKVEWSTNYETQGKVVFGKSGSNLDNFVIDLGAPSRFHALTTSNLQEKTTYYFQVIVYENMEEKARSFIQNIKTGDYHDPTAPKVDNLKIQYITGTAAVITWDADEIATPYVEYDISGTYKARVAGEKSDGEQFVVVGNLKPNNFYYIRAYSVDEDNNKSSYIYKEFSTLSTDWIDKEDLTINYLRPSGPTDSNVYTNSITVSFQTNHYTGGTVSLEKPGGGSVVNHLELGTDHKINFFGLTPGTSYKIKISLSDIFGKRASKEFYVTTRSQYNTATVNTTNTTLTTQNYDYLPSCDSIELRTDVIGYFGRYYNFSSNNMPAIDTRTVSPIPGDNNWFNDQYFVFSRIDGHINFGDDFFPVNQGLNGDPFHFSVYWSAIMDVSADGTYNFVMTSDDDSWLYIDDQLHIDLGGIHGAKSRNANVYLTKGRHAVRIYFIERQKKHSYFSFVPDKRIRVYPMVEDCGYTSAQTDSYTGGYYSSNLYGSVSGGSNNGNVTVAGAEYSRYTPASDLLRTNESPDVYAIVNGKRHYISSPTSFEEYGYRWEDIRYATKEELYSYPRARLLKSPDEPIIYYLYQRPENKWLKIDLPSPTVFISYPGNYWGNVIVVNNYDLDSYPDVKLIKIKDDSTIYYLNNNMKHLVTDEVFEKYHFVRSEVVEVNDVHLDSYQTGEPLK